MLEIPEATVMAGQLNETVAGKRIDKVIAGATEHKFTWYTQDPADYPAKLEGKLFGQSRPLGNRLETAVEDYVINVGDGASFRYLADGEKIPVKHQLLIVFTDGSALVSTVAMYGMLLCFKPGEYDDNKYYVAANQSVSPLTDGFDWDLFAELVSAGGPKLSAKALLATEQRIPGLGNGVLQDILFNAGIRPRHKIGDMDETQLQVLFQSVKDTLAQMTSLGGRDNERNLFGRPGGYPVKMDKRALTSGCPTCHGPVIREAYLGGNVYYCPNCQE